MTATETNGTADSADWEKPLLFVQPNDNHTGLRVIPSALAKLSEIKEKVQVVSIIGAQRGGKSTLMNLLHGRSATNGFGLGHYLDPQTYGLWVWPRRHPRDENVVVLYVDSEGLDAPHVPAHYNWTLSALTFLISSVFMYQSRGNITSVAVEQLDVLLKVAEQVRTGGAEGDASGLGATAFASPEFLWLIRDHQLNMRGSPKQEMLDKLDSSARQAMGRAFRDCDCIPLPRPVGSDDELRNMEKMEFSQLRDDFKEEFVVLERRLLQTVLQEANRETTNVLTGEVLADLVSKYVDALFSDVGVAKEIAQLPTQRQMIVRMAGERAVKAGVAAYRRIASEAKLDMPCGSDELLSAHKTWVGEAEAVFRGEAVLDAKETDEYRYQLHARLAEYEKTVSSDAEGFLQLSKLVGGELLPIWKKNDESSQAACIQQCRSIYSETIGSKVADGSYNNIPDYLKDVQEFRRLYNESNSAKGPRKKFVLEEFMKHQIARDREVIVSASTRKEVESAFKLQLEEAISNLKSLVDAQKQEQDQMQKGIDAFQQTVKDSLVEAKDSNREAVEAVREKLEGKVSTIEQTCTTISQNVSSLELSTEKRFQDAITKVDSVAGEMNVFQAGPFASVQRECEDCKKAVASISSSVDDLKSQQSELQKLNADSSQAVKAVEASLTAEKERLTHTINSNQAEFTARLDGMKETMGVTVESMKEKAADREQYQKQRLDDISAQCSSMSQDVEKKVAEFGSSLKQSLQDVEGKQNSLLEELKAKNKAQHEEVQGMLESLGASLSARIAKDIEVAAANVEGVKTALDEKVCALGEKLDREAETNTAGLEAMRSAITEVRKTHQQMVDNLTSTLKDEFETTVSSVKEEVQGWQHRYEQEKSGLDAKVAATSEGLTSALSAIHSIESKSTSLEESVTSQIESLTGSFTEQIRQVDAKCGELKESSVTNIAALEESLAKCRGLAESVRADMAQVSSERDANALAALEEAQTSARAMTEDLQNQLTNQVNGFDGRIGTMNEGLQAVRNSIAELQGAVGEIESCNNRVASVERSVASLGEASKHMVQQQVMAVTASLQDVDAQVKSCLSVTSQMQSTMSQQEEKFSEGINKIGTQIQAMGGVGDSVRQLEKQLAECDLTKIKDTLDDMQSVQVSLQDSTCALWKAFSEIV